MDDKVESLWHERTQSIIRPTIKPAIKAYPVSFFTIDSPCPLFRFTSQGSGVSSFRIAPLFGDPSRIEGIIKPLFVSLLRL